jgi:L-threonylcarbamoyladenylate synthase
MTILPIESAARALEAGEVVAYPTETVYGLAADVESPAALERLYTLKGRPRDRALSALVPDLAGALRLIPELSDMARKLAAELWPGPLTLVVPARGALSLIASPRGVALRCSEHPVARALAREARCCFSSTSCNRSGQAPARRAEEVGTALAADVPIAAGGDAGGLAPSTVIVVLDDGAVELLREGALPFARVLAVAARTDGAPARDDAAGTARPTP